MSKPAIETRREHARGCGYRKPGGLYLVCEGGGRGCERLPIPLTSCPTCSQGIKPARGWSWIESAPILAAHPCRKLVAMAPVVDAAHGPNPGRLLFCLGCPVDSQMGRVGLLWVGEKYYATPDAFMHEANRQGISRRIPAIPQGFAAGEHWVWLAHRKVFDPEHTEYCASLSPNLPGDCDCEAEPGAGVFQVFKPTRIEYVVKPDDDADKLNRLVDRAVTLVQIEQLGAYVDPPTT